MDIVYEQRLGHRAPPSAGAQKVQFVIVSSKYCNLRCRYCYEFPDLADRRAMSHEQLERMYRSIADHYYRKDHPVELEFDWHGGEPLLLGADFYWRTFDAQTRIFADPQVRVTNFVQTNLTVLNERLVDLLWEGFDGLGVSIDLFSGLRVNTGGKDLQPTVLKNMDRLRQARIPHGAITVLSRQNLPHLEKIFRFFEGAEISPRILAVHRGASETQNDADLLTEDEVLQALKDLFELWMESPAPIAVEPLYSYTERVIWSLATQETSYYDKSQWEYIYLVDTDGNLYSYSDVFDTAWSHGNLFEEPLHGLVNGPRHRRVIEAAEARIKSACSGCRHYGRACSGYPMAEESTGRRDPRPSGAGTACTRERGILDYIEKRLFELGVVGPNGRIDTTSKHYPRFDPATRIPV
ncbi:MAG: radical SAM protein [Nevskia sp.]|nr:radical SAM protein [Nevskia sp.]